MADGIGQIGLARRCVAALHALHEWDGEDGAPTADQRAAMSGWAGWGPLAKAFDWNQKQDAWKDLSRSIYSVLTHPQIEAARSAVDTAFYTPRAVTAAVWDILTGLGFNGGTVLEPGCGAGYFMAAQPDTLAVDWTGVEVDAVSAQIAAALHPRAHIIHAALEGTALPYASFDAVVGNVPFSEVAPYDPAAPSGLNLHNYFIWRALSACRPGGIVALVTSRWTLDAETADQRLELAKLGTFVGAIRLPGAALAPGGTTTVADIVVFRRGTPDDMTLTERVAAEPWLAKPGNTRTVHQTTVSRYFTDNPVMVAGDMVDRGGQRFGQSLEVTVEPGTDIPALLGYSVEHLVSAARDAGLMWQPQYDPAAALAEPTAADLNEGQYTLHDDGSITRMDGGRAVAVRPNDELAALIQLRDAATALFAAEADDTMGANQRERIRQHAMRLYKEYCAHYGYLNRSDLITKKDEDGEPYLERRSPSLGGFRKDPDYVTVLAIELWDDDTQTGKPAQILYRHVNRRPDRKTSTDDPGEALFLCLDMRGHVDLDVIAGLLSIDTSAVPGALEGLIWEDPDDGAWVTSDEYLSGNVRAKLATACRLAGRDPERWSRHVAALEEVQPVDLLPEEIDAQLGSPWIPTDDIARFIGDILGFGRGTNYGMTADSELRVVFAPLTAAWEVHGSTKARKLPAATVTWGTLRVNAINLVEDALNGTMPTVYDPVPGEKDKKVKNEAETQLAAERIRSLQERFAEWVWEEPQRADRLAKLYNERFNCVRVRRYDGSFLTFPGLVGDFAPYQSQRDMVARMIATPAGLCGYSVGAGKTATMVLGALTMRRLGLANKPLMVVPNHLLEQETAEARRLFPGARILMVTKDDLTPERRRAFAAKCAARDLDLVLVTHQQFMSMPVDPSVKADYIAGLIEELDAAMTGDGMKETRTAKQLAKKRKKLVADHQRLLDADRDEGSITFEQTGIDVVMFDEAHACKNLQMSCRAEGFQTSGSKRADDLAMKLGWLRGRNDGGRCGYLFTGTPISNALSELHVLLRYLMPDRLADLGLISFDAFCGMYIRYATKTEVAPDGSGFRSYRRPDRYVNLPELRAMLGEVADIRTREDLALKGPRVVTAHVGVAAQPELADYTGTLVERADAIRAGKPIEMGVNPDTGKVLYDNMLWVCTDGRRAALDLELAGITPTGPGKVEAVAARVAAIYHDTAGNLYPDPSGDMLYHKRPGALQMVFCDQGTPSARFGDQVYGKLRTALVAAGVPAARIAFIHDAASDGDKAALFARCRTGEIAVLVGSTEKCGTGVNVQFRMVAIHHMDAPWRPADVEQRDGRGDRPGNANPDLHIYYYVTESSFDAYMWQALERKKRFIAQILTGDLSVRVVEDGGDPKLLRYADLKAIATGQPLLLELSKISSEVARLRNLSAGHKRAQARMVYDWQMCRETASSCDARATQLEKMSDAAANAPRELVKYSGVKFTDSRAVDQLVEACNHARQIKHRNDVGRWRGITVSVEPIWYRKGAPGIRVRLEAYSYAGTAYEWDAAARPWRGDGPERLLAEIDDVIDRMPEIAVSERARAEDARARAEELKPFLNQDFPHTAALRAALELRDELEREIDAQVRPAAGKAEPVASAA